MTLEHRSANDPRATSASSRSAVPRSSAQSTGNLISEIISFFPFFFISFYAPKIRKQHFVSNSSENSTFVRYLLRPPFVSYILYYYYYYTRTPAIIFCVYNNTI